MMIYTIGSPYYFSESVAAGEEVMDRLKQTANRSDVKDFYLSHCEVECSAPSVMTVNGNGKFVFDEKHALFRFPYPVFSITSIVFDTDVKPIIAFAC